MMHYQSNKKKRSSFVTFGVGVLIAGIFLAVLQVYTPQSFNSAVSSVATPVWKAKQDVYERVSMSASVLLFKTKEDLVRENERLRDELREVRLEMLNHGVLERENKELKKMLGRSNRQQEGILARVLVRPRQSLYDSLIIDVGSRDGLSEGDIITVGAAGIGYIQSASEYTAQARLYSSPGQTFNVTIGADKEVQAQAHGVGGGNFRVQLPRGVAVEEGDVVRSPELPHTIIGHAEVIEKSPSDSFQTIYFRLPVNIYEVKYVTVTPVT